MLEQKILRKFTRILRTFFRKLKSSVQSLKYLYLPNLKSQDRDYVANLLVVKNPIYAGIAKICVESFLYYNPRCSVIIHVDSSTHREVLRKLHRLAKRGKISLNLLENQDLSWQELKLKLVLSLKRQNEFFMDADLRWNGAIPILDAPKFFVEEFLFQDREPYVSLINSSKWEFGRDLSMKNTSFIYWGSNHPNIEYQIVVDKVMIFLRQFCNEVPMAKIEKDSLLRISEQVALSILIDYLEIPITFLKEMDQYRDGSFVESSYFGATGSFF